MRSHRTMRTCSALTMHAHRTGAVAHAVPVGIRPVRVEPYTVARSGSSAVARTLCGHAHFEWCVVACAMHGHSSGAWSLAPCTVTRVVRGRLHHTRSLERCVVACACTLTALGTPLVQDFAQPVGAWSLGLACSTGCALTWSPLLCGRRWLADKTKPPELGAWFEVRSLV